MDFKSLFTFDPEPVMEQAIALALTAEFRTDPNPVVGAILVDQQGKTLSSGFHEKAGSPHAEVVALAPFTVVPPNSILFVTLEPCSFQGKTPPCVTLLLEKQVKTVVVGSLDPNPKVSGKGIRLLKEAGVQVFDGLCGAECRKINRVFNKHILQKIPFVTVKSGVSLDGKIAMASGESQWITGELARAKGHMLRSQHQAMAIGANTLKVDDPRLTDRVSERPKQPDRIVFSHSGEISPASQFVRDKETRRIIVAGSQIKKSTRTRLEGEGVIVLIMDSTNSSIKNTLQQLYQLGICSLLVEGGAELIASFMREEMVDQVKLFLSGKVIGSNNAPAWCGNTGITNLSDTPCFHFDLVEKLGDDLLITGIIER